MTVAIVEDLAGGRIDLCWIRRGLYEKYSGAHAAPFVGRARRVRPRRDSRSIVKGVTFAPGAEEDTANCRVRYGLF
jgi:hypothetical protein